MAKIFIEPSKARATLNQQQALERALKALSQDVGNVRSGLRYKISGREAIDARLREAVGQLSGEAESAKAMRLALEQIINRYEQTEKGNTERVKAEKTSIQNGGNSGSTQPGTDNNSGKNDNDDLEFDWLETLKKLLFKSIGPIGIVLPGIDGLIKGKPGDAISKLLDLIGAGGEQAIDANADWFEDLFGWSKNGLKMTDEMPNFWEKLGDFSSKGKAFSTIVGWGASVADSLFKNAEEFGAGSWTNGRFWGETFIEAGIDIVEGAAIATAVGAGIVAAFGSAPALVIGGATVVATMVADWGLNNLVSWVTNGAQTDWKEAVSDLICDTAEKVVDTVGPVVTKVVDTVVDTGKKVVDTGKKIIDAGADFVSSLFSCKWGKAFC